MHDYTEFPRRSGPPHGKPGRAVSRAADERAAAHDGDPAAGSAGDFDAGHALSGQPAAQVSVFMQLDCL